MATTTMPLNVILASNSPRRKELLEQAKVKFYVQTPSQDVDESLEPDDRKDPAAAVKKLAERKAGAVVQDILAANPTGAGLVIGADTTVVIDGEMLGKPYSADHAREMLRKLSGRTHEVITGVSVWLLMLTDPTEDDPDGQVSLGFRSFHETSYVTFKELDEAIINRYVATGETIDKAGAYAIQGKGAALVERYEGDYDNIVGLPVSSLLAAFPDIERGFIEIEMAGEPVAEEPTEPEVAEPAAEEPATAAGAAAEPAAAEEPQPEA
jgi:septum formation protein